MRREHWTHAELGAAMVAYVESTAKRPRRRNDGIESEAFYRGGDNPTSLRVWEQRATFADARVGVHGGARTFARIVANMPLPVFMKTWGPRASQTMAIPPPRPREVFMCAWEAQALWDRCTSVYDDAEVRDYLERQRGLDVGRIADFDAARALPMIGPLPSWARRNGKDWRAGGYRLVTPLFDVNGKLASLHARSIDPAAKGSEKVTSPIGATTRGLVMADALGRGLLTGADRAHVVHVSHATPRPAVVIVEGLPAFLAWSCDASDADEDAPAVLGLLSGSWTAEHAVRVPDHARVLIDTDHDTAGNAYAARIADTFRGRAIALHRMYREST